MSHSPTETATEHELLKYDRGWAVINRMLRAGASFSGRERDCCYLNLGDGSGNARGTSHGPVFANVSAITGLDDPGDGRALALVDWDFDGDQDFWITSRTGPRVKFLRNDLANGNRYIALRLQGRTCNRDAIGARVEVYRSPDDRRPLIKTLYAGHGYLAQSSKWLHFGLGPALPEQNGNARGAVDHIVVRWPDGKHIDTFRQIEPNRHYELRQGADSAQPWQPPRGPIHLAVKTAEEPKLTDRGRVVVLRPPPLPRIQYKDERGVTRLLGTPGEGPLVVNLWASWCGPCLAELAEWAQHGPDFREQGLRVLALCVDQATDDEPAKRLPVSKVMSKLGDPFALGWPVEATVESLDVLQRTYVARQRPMPVPSSFLMDPKGRLAVIYRGPVSVQQLLSDVKLLEQPLDRIREAAVPFPGRWYSPTEPTPPAAIAGELLDGGKSAAAKDYLQQLVALHQAEMRAVSEPDRAAWLRSQLASAHEALGRLAFDEKLYVEAADAYNRAIEFAPASRGAHLELARTYSALQQPQKVAHHLEAVLKARRSDPENLRRLAMLKAELRDTDQAVALMREVVAITPNSRDHAILARTLIAAADYRGAVAEFRRALTLEADLAAATNDLAWILATCPDASVRDGAEAVKLAQKLCPTSETGPVEYLDTLAAAYAEVGRFDDAVRIVGRAIERTGQGKQSALAQELENRRKLYQSATPYRFNSSGR